MCTQACLMASPCDVVAWDTLARFTTYGGGGCTLNLCHPLMSMANTYIGADDELEECIVGFVDSSRRTRDSVMYGLAYRPSHSGDQYRDVPYEQLVYGSCNTYVAHYARAQSFECVRRTCYATTCSTGSQPSLLRQVTRCLG